MSTTPDLRPQAEPLGRPDRRDAILKIGAGAALAFGAPLVRTFPASAQAQGSGTPPSDPTTTTTVPETTTTTTAPPALPVIDVDHSSSSPAETGASWFGRSGATQIDLVQAFRAGRSGLLTGVSVHAWTDDPGQSEAVVTIYAADADNAPTGAPLGSGTASRSAYIDQVISITPPVPTEEGALYVAVLGAAANGWSGRVGGGTIDGHAVHLSFDSGKPMAIFNPGSPMALYLRTWITP